MKSTSKVSLEKWNEAVVLYQMGFSAREVKEKINLPVTVRSIQRFLSRLHKTRSQEVAYKMAVEKGLVGTHKKGSTIKRMKLPAMLRYMIFKRDKFRCQICGRTAKDEVLLEIDHIDFNPRNNEPQNLQVLCEWCNFGRRAQIAE